LRILLSVRQAAQSIFKPDFTNDRFHFSFISAIKMSANKQPPVCIIDARPPPPPKLPTHLVNETDCDKLLEMYLSCVKGHKNGLNGNDECNEEKLAYRYCIKREREPCPKK
jgi:hypothetical protein